MEIGGQHRLFFLPLLLVLLADPDHGFQRLGVETIGLGLGIDLFQIGGQRRLLLFQALDTGDDCAELVFGCQSVVVSG